MGLLGAGHDLGHELFVQGGRRRLGVAVGGEGFPGVVAAGLGVGGVACAVGGGEHPPARPGRRQPPVHLHLAGAVQQQGSRQGAVGLFDVEGNALAGPFLRQGEGQGIHPFGVLAAQMEPRGAGDEIGTARELPDCDLNVHHVGCDPSFPGVRRARPAWWVLRGRRTGRSEIAARWFRRRKTGRNTAGLPLL